MTRTRREEGEVIMATDRAHYRAYTLRLSQDQDEAAPVWRASLENPHTGERRGFSSLEALFTFLRQCAGVGEPATQPGMAAGMNIHPY